MSKILSNILHPIKSWKKIALRHLHENVDKYNSEEYLKKIFKIKVGYNCNLVNPSSYNEKLQWLKLNYRNDLCRKLSDKFLVRDFIKEKLGEKYLIPLIGVWNSPDEIDFAKLPDQFVLKCNHNSGLGMFICKDKKTIDENAVKEGLRKGLAEDYWVISKEWVYEGIDKKIVCEEFLGDNDGSGINDYKFYCFNGEPKYFLVSSNRLKGVHFNYFDLNKNPLPFSQGGERGVVDLKNIDISEMIEVAKKLSEGFPHVRVDLYLVKGKVYFGEMTFFDSSGFDPFSPRKWDFINGEYLTLPKK